MGSFRAASKGTTTFSTVFQHFAEDQTIVLLRASILNVIYESINRTEEGYPRMRDTKETIDPRDYERLRSSILPNLYYGSFNLTKSRTLGHEIIWKWTEATGKFVGCQFWSTNAKDIFDNELRQRHGDKPTFDKAWSLAEQLSSKDYGPHALNHEHVFPIMKMREILLNPSSHTEITGTIESLANFLERTVVGCVVSKREHEEVHSRFEDRKNPWLRYKGSSIKLVPNPNWSPVHRQLIGDAGLL